MKSSWSMAVVGVVVILFLVYLSTSGNKPPLVPADAQHAGLSTNEACVPCHAPGKASPLKEKHPPKEQCIICHKTATKG